jgi:predicted Rossmann-fold nucleotide-binding protein
MTRVCVFAGSNAGARPIYRTAAEDLGRAIEKWIEPRAT